MVVVRGHETNGTDVLVLGVWCDLPGFCACAAHCCLVRGWEHGAGFLGRGQGGAIFKYDNSDITVINCTFNGNSAGGAVYENSGTTSVTDCTFEDNSASNMAVPLKTTTAAT